MREHVTLRAQVGIIGAGPAGLWLAHLLHIAGISTVVIERRPQDVIASTHRAGILEHGTARLLASLGIAERMHQQGNEHEGIELRLNGEPRRIDFRALTGKSVHLWPQQEVFADLAESAERNGIDVRYETSDAAIHNVTSAEPSITFTDADGTRTRLACDFVAGCDGSHGISREAIPAQLRQNHFREYPFAWFGILVHAEPSAPELIYASSDRGFALISQRNKATQRMYFQCDPSTVPESYSDAQIWDRLAASTQSPGFELKTGEIFDRSVIPMRSYVCEPMAYGRLFLAGDAGHTVPPTGAKGMNLAASDVCVLARSLESFYAEQDEALLRGYSAAVLARSWRAQHFSWWMTQMLHSDPRESPFDSRRRLGELDLVSSTREGQAYLANAYAGLPLIPDEPNFLRPESALGRVLAAQLPTGAQGDSGLYAAPA